MQTFLPYPDPEKSAKVLDRQRLGKQRVEAIQIIRNLLGFQQSKGWNNHPAIRMWKGYEPYLVKVYLRAMLDEWSARGYNNEKSEGHYNFFMTLDVIKNSKPIKPNWITEDLCTSHQSNLLRKNYEYYKPYFSDVKLGLEYIWPI